MAGFRISSMQSRLVICMFYSFVGIRFCFLFNFNVISVISKYETQNLVPRCALVHCRKATDSYLWRIPERICVKKRTHLVKYRQIFGITYSINQHVKNA